MKNVFAAAAVAATMLTASALPSVAATTSPGPTLTNLIDVDNSYKANFPFGSTAGTFATMFDFTVSGLQTIIASVTNSSTKFLHLTNFSISQLTGAGGTVVAGTTRTGSIVLQNGSEQGSIPTFTLGDGFYQLEVDGNVKTRVNSTTGATFNGNVQMSPVPLPTSVALFGVALAGLGVAGTLRRKSATKASA